MFALSEQKSRRLHPVNARDFSHLALEDFIVHVSWLPFFHHSSSLISSFSLRDITTFNISEKHSSEKIPEERWKSHYLEKKYNRLRTSLSSFSNLGPFYYHKTMQMHPNDWCLWKAFEWCDMHLPWWCPLSSACSYGRAKSWLCGGRNVAYQTSKRDFKSRALLRSLNILKPVLALFPSAYLSLPLFSTRRGSFISVQMRFSN